MTQSTNKISGVLGKLRTVSRRLALTAAVISGLGVFALTVMTLANIVIRRAGGGGVPDAVGWGEIGIAAIAFLGLAYTQHLNGHVSTTVVVRLLSDKARYIVTAVWMVTACAIIFWVGLETTEVAISSVQRGESRFGAVPIWPAKVAVAASMWILLFELVVQTLSHVFEPKAEHTSNEEILEQEESLVLTGA